MTPPWCHMFTKAYTQNTYKKIFLSDTTQHTAFVLCIRHHLVNIYQVRSNDAHGSLNGPVLRSHVKVKEKLTLYIMLILTT